MGLIRVSLKTLKGGNMFCFEWGHIGRVGEKLPFDADQDQSLLGKPGREAKRDWIIYNHRFYTFPLSPQEIEAYIREIRTRKTLPLPEEQLLREGLGKPSPDFVKKAFRGR